MSSVNERDRFWAGGISSNAFYQNEIQFINTST